MNDPYRRARVFVQNRFAGILEECDDGYRFSYDTDYLHAGDAPSVSLTLPLSDTPYHSATLFPFFDGLIPEGWLLDIAVKSWKIDRQDRFGLLLAVCRDCIGDVCVRGGDGA